MFADKICQMCASDLSVFFTLRQDLVSKQMNLYEIAGIDESFILQQCEENEGQFTELEPSEFDMEYESVEPDEDTTIFVEETLSEEQQEELVEEEAVLKIEKVNNTNDSSMGVGQDESTCFDLFEEIVHSVESDDQQSQGYDSENIKQEHEM